ncbi:MAG: hypothetical protein KDG58_10465, partial [Anaerolineae bacterium]|nr:hypothetical protein [Anaerolineae bacterium]
VPQGIFVLLGFGILMGVLFGAMALLPSALRRSLGAGLIAVPLVAVIYSSLFSGRGLSAFQALAVFVVVGLALFLWGRYQQPVRARANALPARQQRSMRLGLWVVAILFVLALPALGTYPSEVLVITGIFVLMGLGLNIVVGYA